MTTIKTFAEGLDDYTGSLAQEVEKLELEQARGALNRDEQMDLLGDLRQAVEDRLIRPWQQRARVGLLVGLVLIGAGNFLPGGLPNGSLLRAGATIAGTLSLLLAAHGAWTAWKYRAREGAWLKDLEATVQKGGSVLDAR